MSTQQQAAATCPACHFGCALEKWQCGRGKGIYEQWQASGELPQRKGPGGMPAHTVQQRIVRGCNIAPKALARSAAEKPADSVLLSLMRREGIMREAFLARETGMTRDALAAELATLAADGLIETLEDERGAYASVTQTGRQRASELEAARDASHAAFLAALSDDEQQQLADLLDKLLMGNRPHGGGR